MKSLTSTTLIKVGQSRKGASTVEFLIILPLFILLALVLWQLVLAGLAVMNTQAALRDAARVAATTGDEKKAEEVGRESFGKSSQFKLKGLKVEIENEEVTVSAKTEINMIFMKNMKPMSYSDRAEAPVLKAYSGAYGMIGEAGGPLLTEGGILGPPIGVWKKTSGFGYRVHPVTGRLKKHTGLDLGAPHLTPIYAAEAGVVTRAGASNGYGNLIVIDHGNGLVTRYAHMKRSSIYVRVGDRVSRGQHIAGVGSEGVGTGAHLHFEVMYNGVFVNPEKYVNRSMVARN
ncbi:M23 family metallopeptidase [Hazenella sp. IB182353]|uniref:M23 family metallopeptidase n=1 Tax=Polycladospora coralii TaxID=2771432 RepID=UPI001746877D|nr:M23 family metallopeptidase [Polycladospora coralii]MBS7531743.1 M23 family metallopeptidase [Polycladospora coralii]